MRSCTKGYLYQGYQVTCNLYQVPSYVMLSYACIERCWPFYTVNTTLQLPVALTVHLGQDSSPFLALGFCFPQKWGVDQPHLICRWNPCYTISCLLVFLCTIHLMLGRFYLTVRHFTSEIGVHSVSVSPGPQPTLGECMFLYESHRFCEWVEGNKISKVLKVPKSWGPWVAPYVKHLTIGLSSGMISVGEFKPRVWPYADSFGACLEFSVSLFLCPSPPHSPK